MAVDDRDNPVGFAVVMFHLVLDVAIKFPKGHIEREESVATIY